MDRSGKLKKQQMIELSETVQGNFERSVGFSKKLSGDDLKYTTRGLLTMSIPGNVSNSFRTACHSPRGLEKSREYLDFGFKLIEALGTMQDLSRVATMALPRNRLDTFCKAEGVWVLANPRRLQ